MWFIYLGLSIWSFSHIMQSSDLYYITEIMFYFNKNVDIKFSAYDLPQVRSKPKYLNRWEQENQSA